MGKTLLECHCWYLRYCLNIPWLYIILKLTDILLTVWYSNEIKYSNAILCFLYYSYIYTDEVDLKPDTVMFILYASKKYMMSGLTDKCTQYLKSNLDASNACTVLEQSIFFEEAELQERCLKCIKYKTKAALESETSLNIGLNTLSKILSLEMFTVKEVWLNLYICIPHIII